MSIAKTIRKMEYKFDMKAEKFLWHHPLPGFFFLFIGMPLFILLGVCICTAIIAFPMVCLHSDEGR